MENVAPLLKKYTVTVMVQNAFNEEPVPGCSVTMEDSVKLTGDDGKVLFHDVPGVFKFSAQKELFYPFDERARIIHSDTTLYITLSPVEFQVQFILKDSVTGESFWGVNVELNGINAVTDNQGTVTYSLPAGSYDYFIDKVSYRNEAGNVTIVSDTTFTIFLVRTQAYIKFRLRREETPVNKAMVYLGSDSLESNNLGIALFDGLDVNNTYSYAIKREYYRTVTGSIFLETDTTVNILMETDTASGTGMSLAEIPVNLWPNPAGDHVNISIPAGAGRMTLKVIGTGGKVMEELVIERSPFILDLSDFPSGPYLLQFSDHNRYKNVLLVKK